MAIFMKKPLTSSKKAFSLYYAFLIEINVIKYGYLNMNKMNKFNKIS